jgi:flagellar biosynthetic protein FlhB
MAEENDDSQKTEEPTHKRLEDARKQGQVATSREVNHWFMIGAGALWIAVFGPAAAKSLGLSMVKFIEMPETIPTDPEHLRVVLMNVLRDAGSALLVPLLIMMAAALAAGLLQGGFVIALDRITPKLEKISLAGGAKRLFSLRAILEFLKGLLKLTVVAAVVTLLIMPRMENLPSFAGLETVQITGLIYDLSKDVLIYVLSVVTVIAALDFLYQKFEFRKSLRMSRHELREEFKQTEGDPMIKSRLRQIRMERARRRMMAAVPEADVVITNPTHFAVALKYEPSEMTAPTVVAKGVDFLAQKIRDIAQDNAVAIVENPPLARALYAGVELDQEIPAEHYKAVAEIIGYVFRLKRKVIPK